MAKKTAKRNAGRPPIEFDLEVVEGLGRIGATAPEMAHVLPASQSTIEHRLADAESDFSKAYRKGQSLLKASLRRKQIAVGLAGNVTMLIWLGKQHLGQHDRQDVRASSVDVDAMIKTLSDTAQRAYAAGDEPTALAAVRALQRIVDGEDVSTVYSQWLLSQPPPR